MKRGFNLLVFAVMVIAVGFGSTSCKKHKQRKAYENTYGNYTCEDSIFMCEFDNGYKLYANGLSIAETAISFSSVNSNSYSSIFKTYGKSDNSIYDYQLLFSKTLLFGVDSEGGISELPSLTTSELNEGKRFYFKVYDNNSIDFIIVYDSGEVKTYSLNK